MSVISAAPTRYKLQFKLAAQVMVAESISQPRRTACKKGRPLWLRLMLWWRTPLRFAQTAASSRKTPLPSGCKLLGQAHAGAPRQLRQASVHGGQGWLQGGCKDFLAVQGKDLDPNLRAKNHFKRSDYLRHCHQVMRIIEWSASECPALQDWTWSGPDGGALRSAPQFVQRRLS